MVRRWEAECASGGKVEVEVGFWRCWCVIEDSWIRNRKGGLGGFGV